MRAAFEIARAYMVVSADMGEAEAEVDEFEGELAELHGTVRLDADGTEARSEIKSVQEEADTSDGTMHIGADGTEARAEIAAVQEEADTSDAAIPVGITGDASADLDLIRGKLEELEAARADIPVDVIGDAPAELALIDAEMDRLEAKHAELSVSVRGGTASMAELAALAGEITALQGEIDAFDSGGAVSDLKSLESAADELHGALTTAADGASDLRGSLATAGDSAGDAAGPVADLADRFGVMADLIAGAKGRLDDADAALSGTGNAASGLGDQVLAASDDIRELSDRLSIVAQEWHELDQISDLPGMGSARSEIEGLAGDLDAVYAHGTVAAGALEEMNMRLDAVSDTLNTAEARMGEFGNGIEHVTADVHSAAGMYDDVAGILGNLGDDAVVAGTKAEDGMLRARTGASLLDDAMVKVHGGMQDAWDAATSLNLSLSKTDDIGKAASATLKDLGASDLQAAAGANALVKAQAEFDALATSGGGGGIAGWISELFGIGGEGGGLAGTIGSLSAGIGVAYAFVAAMAEVGGIVTGVSAALVGIAPAVALAIPSLLKLKDSYSAISSARTAWTQAEQVAKRDPTAANLAAAATAAAKLKVAYADVPPYIRPVMKGISGLTGEYTKMAKAFEPDVFKIFDEGLGIASNLLKQAPPLADAAATGIEGLLKQADKFTESKGFKAWLKQITPDIAPSIKAIGTTIGTIALDWGKFMKTFSPQDIKTAFHILDDVINWWSTGWTHAITDVMTMWDDFSTAFKNVKTWISEGVDGFKLFLGYVESTFVPTIKGDMHDVSNAVDAVRETYVRFGHDVEDAVDTVRETIVHVGHDIESAWDKVTKDADDLKTDVVADFDDLKTDVVADFDDLKTHVVQYADDLKTDVAADWDWLKTHVIQYADDIKNDVVTDWDYLKDHVIDAVHTTVSDVESTWDTAKSKVESTVDTLVHDVVTEFGKLPGQLVTLGKNAVMGFVHGMEDVAGDIASEAEHLASLVPKGLSDILHYGSPSLLMREKGHDTMEGFRLGILDYEDPIVSAMKQVGTAAAGAGTTAFSSHGAPVPVASTIGHAPSAGGTNVTVNLNGIMAFPNPEQVHAIQMALATAVGGAG
jgi:hypothetical protein